MESHSSDDDGWAGRRRCSACRKRRYTSRGQAVRASRTMGDAYGNVLRAYRCLMCRQWHLTSQDMRTEPR